MTAQIKIIKEYKEVLDLDNNVLSTFLTQVTELDKNGNTLKDTKYREDGSVDDVEVMEYNDKGKLVESSFYFNGDELHENLKFVYFEDGETINEILKTFGDGSIEKTIVEKEGNVYTSTIFNEDDESEGVEIVKKDDNGNVVEHVIYNDMHQIESRDVYCYDANGNILERIHFGYDDVFENKKVSTYNDKGFCTAITYLDEKGNILEVTKYTLDENGNVTYMREGDYQETFYAYNINGDVVSVKTIDLESNTVSFQANYEYDNNNLQVGYYPLIGSYQRKMSLDVFMGAEGKVNKTRTEYEFY